MEYGVFPEGSRVQIVSYGPFRGLKGTIRTVHYLLGIEDPLCFYQIVLEGTRMREPIWFECDEVDLLTCPSCVPQEPS